MKNSLLRTAFSLACVFTHTVAVITWDPFPDVVEVKQNYSLSWTATANYTYVLQLFHTDSQGNYSASDRTQVLIQNRNFPSLQPKWNWTVPSNLLNKGHYLFHLFGSYNDGSTSETSSNETGLFRVSFSNVPQPTFSLVPTASSGSTVTPAPTSGSTASAVPNNGHHTGISGGAIAGIVIGILILVAIVIGAMVFISWRKKRNAFQKREAAARANRLAPVLQKGASEATYEMHPRSP